MKRVLIVDDEEAIGMLVGAILDAEGFETKYAPSAIDAVMLLANHQFDKLVLDLNLGSSHGLDLMPAVRRLQEKVDVVVISAHHGDSVRKAVLAEGIKHFLKKPFGRAQLLRALE